MKMHVYDMDGTIVCSMHRYRTIIDSKGVERIDLLYWIQNEHKAGQDSLLPLAEQYKQDLQDPKKIVVIATARHIQAADMRFIKKYLGFPAFMVSRRGRSDTRSGGVLKSEGLQKILRLFPRKPLVHFWEDNVKYLETVCKTVGATGHYVKSNQSH